MKFIKTRIDDGICHIVLDRGKSNAMDINMIQQLRKVIDNCKVDEGIFGIILTGKEGFFSAGLDLIALYDYNHMEMEELWNTFLSLVHDLLCFPKPFISAISGHAPAGGCVLALCSDYRIMANDADKFIIGLNEVPVGIIVPECIFDLYRFWLGNSIAYQSLLSGKLFTPNEAFNINLVDEIVPFNKIQVTAISKIKTFLQFDKSTWSASKINIRKSIIESFRKDKTESIIQVLEQWWKPSTRRYHKTVIDGLKHK